MRYDFHTHTKYSHDGFIEPYQLVKAAKRRGLSGIAVTDHNTIKGALKVKKYDNSDFKVICGSEISTERGEVIGLFLNDQIESHLFEEVVEEIRDQGGMVIIPHPFDGIRKNGIYPDKSDIKFIDAVEVFNSRCLSQKYNDQANRFAKENELGIVAGSDAHFAREVGNAGVIIKEEDIRKVITRGNVEIFGEKSSLLNLGLTKVLKIWRKTRSG
ncbi:MAG TPA: PHP domain-containing protein [Methanothermobacter sp.]|nr:PHP domain-containing protein [Methanothermobacter sp.]